MKASSSRRVRRRRRRSPSPEAATTSIDSLPSEILEDIVGRLPIRCAVRTSALSRDWRRRWESSPGIRFDWTYHDAGPDDVVGVLARYACPVGYFHYAWDYELGFDKEEECLDLLAVKGVKSLSLSCGGVSHTVGSGIFSCRELTDLVIAHCCFPASPAGFTGFPKLTKLVLISVGFREHGEKTLEEIICLSPSLESLVLNDVWIDAEEFDEWVIRAPNLKYLSIETQEDYLWQIEELPSIEKIYMMVDDETIERDYVELLTSFAQVRELEFFMPTIEDNVLEGLSCSFLKLKRLTLHMKFCNASSILSTFSLLRSCPNLEHFVIENYGDDFQSEEVDLNFFNTLSSNDLFSNLEVLILKNAPCLSNDMHFIEFVLSKARLLRDFFVYRDDISSYSKPTEEAVIELATFRRVSPKAKVFFRNMEDYCG